MRFAKLGINNELSNTYMWVFMERGKGERVKG